MTENLCWEGRRLQLRETGLLFESKARRAAPIYRQVPVAAGRREAGIHGFLHKFAARHVDGLLFDPKSVMLVGHPVALRSSHTLVRSFPTCLLHIARTH